MSDPFGATLDAVGNSETFFGHRLYVIVGGTFTATVNFQIHDPVNDNWVDIDTPLTAPGIFSYILNSSAEFRVRVSAYTSGTVEFYAGIDNRGWI